MSSNNANIIDGKAFSNHLIETLIPDIKTISNIIGRPPTLAVILVGEDSASQVYVRNKIRQTEAAGMISIEHRLSADTDEKTLLAQVKALNDDDNIDGILV
ncbi:MAG: bifunctional methylenetetrahydrofolate dehydrogenase/methenyltetrahydrofolate cyclohydrolase, partial [Alphaproteobacteria bacterium]|nr:bifunctional methylenetetrahydrofolate dehydrogenase/methenyltetrahydrofolate cyclohydrolase [Alphaproteobacteria bacterium]